MDSNSPIDWGNIARLAELDKSDTQVQDVQWEEPPNFSISQFPPPDGELDKPLQPGQFDRFGR